MSDIKKGIVGVAGEFFVAAELSQRGVVATLTDILATPKNEKKALSLLLKGVFAAIKTLCLMFAKCKKHCIYCFSSVFPLKTNCLSSIYRCLYICF
jgi:hypothetical protein